MRNAGWLILCHLMVFTATAAAQQDNFRWPGEREAAVSLTYDDGVDAHLDHAAPDLDAAALRGTFYVTGGSESVWNRMDEWRDLARRGHEIGNHSLNHPCTRVLPDGVVREWLWPERALEAYTVRQMANELRVANILFTALDGRRERTYAYTCTDEVTGGGDSYVDAIKPLFPAARAGRDPNFTPVPDGRDGPVTDMRALDLYRVPSWMVIDVSGDEMIAYIERAARAGGMAVIMFHGVGGGHSLNVSREAHRQVLRFWMKTATASGPARSWPS